MTLTDSIAAARDAEGQRRPSARKRARGSGLAGLGFFEQARARAPGGRDRAARPLLRYLALTRELDSGGGQMHRSPLLGRTLERLRSSPPRA